MLGGMNSIDVKIPGFAGLKMSIFNRKLFTSKSDREHSKFEKLQRRCHALQSLLKKIPRGTF